MVENKFNISEINPKNQEKLVEIYKEVFSGHPWHEDKICLGCKKAQYTSKECSRHDYNKLDGTTSNDCRETFKAREGLFFLPEKGLEKCLGCGQDLKLINFYPDFVNHIELIEESTKKDGFIGSIIFNDRKPIGFTWGYQIPKKRTISVNFPAIEPMLLEKGISPEKAFYGAETGVLDSFQNKGLGYVLISKRIIGAKEKGFNHYTARTINPYIHFITNALFSGKQGKFLFKDPERGSSWFSWDFKDFDYSQAKKRTECLL